MHWPKGERGPDLGKKKLWGVRSLLVLICHHRSHCSITIQSTGWILARLVVFYILSASFCLPDFVFVFFNMCCKVFLQFEAARRDHLDWKNINTKEKRERKSDFLASSVKHHDEAEFLHHFSFSRLGDFFCFFRVVYSKKKKKRKGKPSSATLSRTTRGSSDSSSLWPP